MICTLEQKHIEAFNPTNILPQTPFWGRVKNNHGFQPLGFELSISKDLLYSQTSSSHVLREDLLILIRYLPHNQCFAYVPYGPKLEPDFENHGLFLEELSECIREHLPANCLFIRYDLMWQNQWAKEETHFDAHGNWMGPPQNTVQEFRVNYKTNNWNLRKSTGDLLPKNTFFLDLQKKESELLQNMRYNTRYNIKKAIKRGIQVQEYGTDHIQKWYNLYLDTATRHQMSIPDVAYFRSILENQDHHDMGVNVKMLMADLDGVPLASMFLVLSKNRGIYLYGASSSDKANAMASYALQWESIKIAKEWGCSEYDMFGSAPNLDHSHPLHGVHIYKKGFGGQLYHRMGCWDYPFQTKGYDEFVRSEIRS